MTQAPVDNLLYTRALSLIMRTPAVDKVLSYTAVQLGEAVIVDVDIVVQSDYTVKEADLVVHAVEARLGSVLFDRAKDGDICVRARPLEALSESSVKDSFSNVESGSNTGAYERSYGGGVAQSGGGSDARAVGVLSADGAEVSGRHFRAQQGTPM